LCTGIRYNARAIYRAAPLKRSPLDGIYPQPYENVVMMLTTLTNEEERLMTIVAQQAGSMEAKHQALERLGIFDTYATIHQAYADLACTANALEAVKRAIFLQWYASAEPACFTGIFNLHAQAEHHVVKCLNQHISDGTLDPESAAMLRWLSA
jgi:hypothetical protein